MPPKYTFEAAPAKSIAEAKLERQRKRIEEAEASLGGQAAVEKRPPVARTKNAKWKPFDLNAESTSPATHGGAPVAEVRINTFRPQSRASSIPRPVSVMSHSTSETGPSDMERQDSALTDAGVQLYQGRKNRRHVGDLNVHEDKSPHKQATVEATFDRREIYEVFGNALPGPEFIEENVGFKNGQLQFLQHPNGDVSAHQWSSERYMWENIGQFSNIRKKTEGQLAADRLRGETAYQTMQRETLAYFKTVAKQREANVMGLAFGAKEIQDAMPDQKMVADVEPTVTKGTSTQSEEQERTSAKTTSLPFQPTFNTRAQVIAPATSTAQQLFPQYAPTGPRTTFTNLTPNVPLRPTRQEDPFFTSLQQPQAYGQYQYGYSYYEHMPPQRSYVPMQPAYGYGLNQDFQFPPLPSSTVKPDRAAANATRPAEVAASRIRTAGTLQQNYDGQAGSSTDHREAERTAPSTGYNVSAPIHHSPLPPTDISAPQPQHAVARSAARDQLWKLTETAKERSQSQANIRTVLHDPFQIQKTPLKPNIEDETTRSHAASSSTQNKPPSPSGSTTSNDLLNSSPDNKPLPNTTHAQATPAITKSSDSKGTPQTLRPPFFPEELSLQSSSSVTSSASKTQNPAESLESWWNYGNKFARQEEFYQSLKRMESETPSKLSRPSAHLTSIGPLSCTPKQASTSNNSSTIDISRLLIPVLENLSSYVQGPVHKRRDYWSQWSQPPEWAIDTSPEGLTSFYDKDWGTPPARVGRDPRYNGSRSWQPTPPRRGRPSVSSVGYGSPAMSFDGGTTVALDRRFAFGGRY